MEKYKRLFWDSWKTHLLDVSVKMISSKTVNNDDNIVVSSLNSTESNCAAQSSLGHCFRLLTNSGRWHCIGLYSVHVFKPFPIKHDQETCFKDESWTLIECKTLNMAAHQCSFLLVENFSMQPPFFPSPCIFQDWGDARLGKVLGAVAVPVLPFPGDMGQQWKAPVLSSHWSPQCEEWVEGLRCRSLCSAPGYWEWSRRSSTTSPVPSSLTGAPCMWGAGGEQLAASTCSSPPLPVCSTGACCCGSALLGPRWSWSVGGVQVFVPPEETLSEAISTSLELGYFFSQNLHFWKKWCECLYTFVSTRRMLIFPVKLYGLYMACFWCKTINLQWASLLYNFFYKNKYNIRILSPFLFSFFFIVIVYIGIYSEVCKE